MLLQRAAAQARFVRRRNVGLVAGAYRTPTTLLLHPTARTATGLNVGVPPVRRLRLDADPQEVGATLREFLTSPPTVVPPDDWRERAGLGQDFLHEAGYRSWKKLEEGAVSCWIEVRDGAIVFTPLRNGGRKGSEKGFQPFGASLITVAVDAEDPQLGAAVLEALSRSE